MTIFISHSSRDQKVARTLCDALEARGMQCWIANRDVHPGENFQEAIVKAIRAARVMVLVFTKHANNSDEIKKEIALASQHELVVIPVRIDDVMPNDALAYELATRQWIDLFQDWERAIERLTARIAAVVAIGTPPAEVAPAAPGDAPVATRFGLSPQSADSRMITASYATLSLNIHLLGGFIVNVTTFLLALMMIFMASNNFAGAFVTVVLAMPMGILIRGLIDKDQNVRMFGLIIGIVGLLAVGAVNGLPYVMRIPLLEDKTVQQGSLLTGIYFLAAAVFFSAEWKKFSNLARQPNKATAWFMKVACTRWGAGFIFASSLMFVSVTWTIIYKLTDSVLALLALMACHVAAVVYCYLRFRRDITPAEPAVASATAAS